MADRRIMDTDWLFHYGDTADAGFMGYDDRAWRHVTLPHDWAVEYPFDKANSSGTGYLPGGTAWYRKHFSLPEDIGEKSVRIAFEGVYGRTRVWINSNYLGAHAYKYTSFSMDLTPFIKPGENVVSVRVEHEQTADSRWYTGSGICRHVYLETTPKGGFLRDSLFVRTERLGENRAILSVDYKTGGMEDITFRLIDREGCVAAETHADKPYGTASLSVPDPHSWSPDDPYLYTLSCTAASGSEEDTETIPAGIRTFSFDPDKGFFLNGTGMKIKGVCVHHDAGCLGAAVPESVWEKRLRKLKEAGCNALRTAHNPPDPGLLDLCDSMGFLVMDEAFDEWEGIKNKWWQGHNVYPPKHYGYGEDFPEWHVRDLESMVLRDRNHPSIIIWSIGNEIDYPNDPYVTPLFEEVLGNNDAGKPAAERVYDPRKPDARRLAAIAKELTGIVHRLDSTRPVLSALSFPELSNRTGFADALDIVGYNYREHFYKADHASYPGRVLLGSENSHTSAAWYAVRDNDFISAQFLWTGIDFLGECPDWPVRISRAGMLDLACREKPLFSLRKALWTKEPAARIAVGEGNGEDKGPWNETFLWEGKSSDMKRVSVYTNETEAELFLNGRSLGKKALRDEDGCRLVWEVPYAQGELRCVTPHAHDSLYTPCKAEKLRLVPDRTRCPAERIQAVTLEISLEDAQGRAAKDETVTIQVLGDLKLLGIENGRPDDLTPYSENFRQTLCGHAVAYVRAGTCPGKASVCARTESGLSAEITLELTKP